MFPLVTTLIGTRSYLHDCHLLLGSPRKKKKSMKSKSFQKQEIFKYHRTKLPEYSLHVDLLTLIPQNILALLMIRIRMLVVALLHHSKCTESV